MDGLMSTTMSACPVMGLGFMMSPCLQLTCLGLGV
jgi:hypothetical protein